MPLLFLFILMPVVELYILLTVGGMIGAGWTIALVFLTAFIGWNLLRHQGLSTLFRAQEKMATGELPASEMLEGMMLAVAGALLLTPGFVTDTIGFLLLTPFVRKSIAGRIIQKGVFVMGQRMQGFRSGSRQGGNVYESWEHQSAEQDGRRTDVYVQRIDIHSDEPEDEEPTPNDRGDVIEGELLDRDDSK